MKRAPRIVIQLVHIQGPSLGTIQEFEEAVVAVGRHPDSQVRFPADLKIVSRKHAEIVREGNRFKVVDHSTNGTYVNGKRVQEAFLKDGDVLAFAEVGPKVSFLTKVVEDEAPPSAAPRTPQPAAERPVSGEPQPSPVPPQPPAPEPPPAPVPPQPAEPPPPRTPGAARPQPPPEAPEIRPVKVPLVIQYGPTLRSFRELPIVLGRHPRVDCVMDHPDILDHHVQFFFARDTYWVKDLTGQGKISINGQPIAIHAPLHPHDEVSLGPRGPVFVFFGGGRLAEKELPPLGSEEESPRSTEASKTPERPQEPKKSFFKKFLGDK